MLFNAFSQFHFLRPEWFLALIPVLLLLTGLRFEKKSQGDWQHIIPQHLLKHLLHEKQGSSSNRALALLAMLWLLSTIALAGPTWQKVSQPVYEKIEARVYVLDLSYSMYAADIKPNRIVRARLKLLDLLNSKREGLSALVVFSGDAHIVTPLTNDVNTIASLIPALEPNIMPNVGSNAKAGVLKALELLANTQIENGEIILITDEVLLNDRQNINALLESSPYTLSIMSVGSIDGAPIKLPNGQFLKDSSGAIVIPKVNEQELERLASDNGGRYVQLRQDDKDVRYLQKEKSLNPSNDSRESQQSFDLWLEAGQWLMFPIILLAALAFRKGWLLAFLLCVNMFPASDTLYADEVQTQQKNQLQQESQQTSQQQTQVPRLINKISEGWQALWLTGDQRGLASLQAQNFSDAAKQFNHQDWKAIAHYYNGQFAQAAEIFKPNTKSSINQQADAWYNQGNALARAGYLDGAIAAYDKSLALISDNEDAIFNKKLLEDLKNKQSEQAQDQNKEQNNQDQKQEQEKNGEKNSDKNDAQQSEQQDSEQTSEQESQQNDSQQSDKNSDQQSQQEQESEQSDENEEGKDANKDQQNSDETTSDTKDGEQTENAADDALSPLEREKQQALEQWLREVPDDPSGLMRRKFELENKRNKNNTNEQQQAW